MYSETVFKLSEDLLKASFQTAEFMDLINSVSPKRVTASIFLQSHFDPGLHSFILDLKDKDSMQCLDHNQNAFTFQNGHQHYVLAFNLDCVYFKIKGNTVTDIVIRKRGYSEETDSSSIYWFLAGSVLVPNDSEVCHASLQLLLRKINDGSASQIKYLDYVCQLILLSSQGQKTAELENPNTAFAAPNLSFRAFLPGEEKIPYTDLTVRALGLSDAQAESVTDLVFSAARYLSASYALKNRDLTLYNEILSEFSKVFNHRENIIQTLKQKP